MIKLSDIQEIREKCISLLTNTEKLRRNNSTREAYQNAEKLFPLIQKLLIATVMHNKHLICVSGLQGAGKTTLMKNFYGIGDEFMNVSIGRGERVPVLITEGNVSETYVMAVSISKNEDGEYSMTETKLEKDEIVAATKGEDPSIMYIEITVPYKYTNNNAVSFMLLPGFEKKNEYWNNLIEFSVNSSSAAVFVFSESSFSNANNADYLDKITQKFGSNVVYAISGSDGSADDNAQVKNTCMEVLRIPKQESDRVVCVGQYNDTEKNNAWIKSFLVAIDKYAMYETQVTQKNSAYIYDELLKVKDTLYTILDILNEGDAFEPAEYKNHTILRAFDDAVEKQKKHLSECISEEFDKAKSSSRQILAQKLDDTPWYKSLKKSIFGANVKEQYIETQNIIKSSLEDGRVMLPDLHLGNAVAKSLRTIDSPIESKPNAFQCLVDTKEEKGIVYLKETEDNQNVFDDIKSLIRVPNKSNDKQPLKYDDTKLIAKAIAEMTTYYFGMMSYDNLAEKTPQLRSYVPAESHLKSTDIINGAESSKKFAIGMAGVMGVDIVADGSLNLISQVAGACGLAIPVAGAAVGLIVGVGAAVSVMKDVNKMQRADFESGALVIDAIYDNLQRDALTRYDRFANMIRERIEENLAYLGGGRKQIINNYNAKIDVNNLLDLIDATTKEYLKATHGIESSFSR